MLSQCPDCQRRLAEFAVSCRHCGWTLVSKESRDQNGSGQTNGNPGPSVGGGNSAQRREAIDLSSNSRPSLEITESASLQDPLRSGDPGVDLAPPSQIDLQIQKAKELIAAEDFGKAVAFLNRAIADAPGERLAECHSLRGYVYYCQGDVIRAEEECTLAIARNGEDANTFAWRAAARGEQKKWRLAFDDLQAACDIAGSDRDEYFQLMDSYLQAAKAEFQHRVQAGVDSAELFFERGWVYYRCSKLVKAERDFKFALARESDHPWASLGLALVHREAGITRHLTQLLEAALQGDHECQRAALEVCAEAHDAMGDVAAAHKDLDHLTRLAGDDPRRIVETCQLRNRLGDHIAAIEQLTRLLDQDPDNHFASLVRGNCYQGIKNYPLAIKDYTRFLRFFPEHLDALVQRAECFLATRRFPRAHEDLDVAQAIDHANYPAALLRARLLLTEEKLDEALTECDQAVRLDNQARGFAVKAEIYHKLCDYTAAIEEYSRAIELARDDEEKRAEYTYLRGTILYELEDFDAAFRDFETSCQLRPQHSGAWVWKAATASRLERWPTAIQSLQQAIAVRPAAAAPYQKLGKPVAERAVHFFDQQQQRSQATVDTFRDRGMAHQFLGNLEEAFRDFSQALEMEADVDTRIRRGQVLATQAKHDAAIEDFARVIRSEPENHWARYCRAQSYQALGQIDQAKRDIKKALKASPEQPRYHLMLAEVRQAESQPAKVIRSLDKALWYDPTDPTTYRRRGTVHAECGELLPAIRDFTHALELDPSRFDILVARGEAYRDAEQETLAREDFELALTHDPTLAKAYSGRASVLVKEGELEYTLIWLTKAIHRFRSPRDLAEILFARGKVFVQMGRFVPAASDFSAVIELTRTDPATVIAARRARALTNIHAERFDKAAKDYRRIQKLVPGDERVEKTLKWLENPGDPRPDFIPVAEPTKRPTRPPVVRNGVKLGEDDAERWKQSPPHDTWIVRTAEKKEYGPVHFNILQTWLADGRIDVGMKLLRADWSKWKRAEKIFASLLPFHQDTDFVDDFPGINV